MFSRRPLAVVVTGLIVSCGLVLALVGCFRLGVPGLALVAIAAAAATALAWGVPSADRSAAVRRAELVAEWTVAVPLLAAGVEALAGGVVAAVAVSLAAAAVASLWLVRLLRRKSVTETGRVGIGGVRLPHCVSPHDLELLATLRDMKAPLHRASTAELGREWLRTTAVLAGPLDPDTRQSIIRRRSDALDELERRDPAGFSRWLTDRSCHHSDPAGFVRASSPEG